MLDLRRKSSASAGQRENPPHANALAALEDGRAPVASAKLSGVDPERWLADVLHRIGLGHPVNRLGELLPWNRAATGPTSHQG
jgi:hypothetical protein